MRVGSRPNGHNFFGARRLGKVMRVGSRPNGHNFSGARRLGKIMRVGSRPNGHNFFMARRLGKVMRVGSRPNGHNICSGLSDSEKLCMLGRIATPTFVRGYAARKNMCAGPLTCRFCYSFERSPFGIFVLLARLHFDVVTCVDRLPFGSANRWSWSPFVVVNFGTSCFVRLLCFWPIVLWFC